MTGTDFSRRDFLQVAGSATIGAMLAGDVQAGDAVADDVAPETETKPVIEYRTLGRTGIRVSVISMGTGGSVGSDALRFGMDRGLNLIHTGLSYGGGKTIHSVAEAIKGRRDAVIIALKITMEYEFDRDLEHALAILGISHVDICMFPIHHPKAVKNRAIKEAFDRWKAAGKARFMGLTTHTRMKQCMEAAIETDWYDVLMPAFQLAQAKEFESVLKRCREKNIAVMPMKTKNNLSIIDYEEAISLYLSEKSVATIVKGMKTFEEVDRYIAASRRTVTGQLHRKAALFGMSPIPGRCRMCGRCTEACPNDLDVSDIVRSVSYYLDISRNFSEGRCAYLDIPSHRRASQCRGCGACEHVCPNAVPIRRQIQRAEALFERVDV